MASDLTEPPPSIGHVRQEWPEDAYVAWKREHYLKGEHECPDDDAEHCAFMSGIAYAEKSIKEEKEAATEAVKESWLHDLLSIYDDLTALNWLATPHKLLDGLTPMQAIGEGRESDVDCIVQQLTSGAYL